MFKLKLDILIENGVDCSIALAKIVEAQDRMFVRLKEAVVHSQRIEAAGEVFRF